MSDFDLKPDDFINQRERFNIKPKGESIDKAVSALVGKDIRTTDPRLINLITKWKQEGKKTDDPNETPDNFLENENKINELKQIFI